MTRLAGLRGLLRRDRLALVGGLACVALAAAFPLTRSATAPETFAITGGSPDGIRHAFAELLAEEARAFGLDLRVEPSAGSVDAVAGLASGRLDFALVQGGLGVGDAPTLRQLTALHLEPLHLLVRGELADEVAASSLQALRGRRVNVSAPDSGTRRLAESVLGFAGLAGSTLEDDTAPNPVDDVVRTEQTYGELLAARSAEALPDAVFTASSMPSPVARRLVERWGYRLVSLDFASAYAIDGVGLLAQGDDPRLRVDRRAVDRALIPRAMYDRAPPVPARDVPTLGTRLLLLTRDDVPEREAFALLRAVFETRFARVGPGIGPELLAEPPELPLHASAERYRRRELPVLTGETLSVLDASLNIAAPVLGGVLFLWTWLRQRRRRVRETHFVEYVRRVNQIEREALAIDRLPHTPIGRLVELQRQLTEMKTEALERFALGEVRGEEVLTGFASLVKDARDYITRLIAQEHIRQDKPGCHDDEDGDLGPGATLPPRSSRR